jgi:8-oxo-dGTP pyrophosphatase MutT (NUDIX family)
MTYDGPSEVDAGGILLDGPLGPTSRLAVIRRTSQQDWTLPKGHVEPGESLEQAARREVEEETGYVSTCQGIAGAIAYQREGSAKCVTFFFFLRDTDSPRPGALDGVEAVEWLSFDDAGRRVSHPELVDLLDRVQTDPQLTRPPASSSQPRGWHPLRRLSSRHDRLDAAIATYARELPALRSMPRVASPADHPAWWRPAADELLGLARTLATQGRIDPAWDALNLSRRLSLRELGAKDLATTAVVVEAEVGAKLHGWRKEAATGALSTRPCTVEEVIEAQRMLDETSTNSYVKLKMAGRRLLVAALLLALTILCLWLATAAGWFDNISVQTGTFVLHNGELFGGVLLLGIFGAMLSLALDLSRSSSTATQSRIYDLATTQIAVPVARISIGAGSAVLTVAAAQVALVGGDAPWLYLAAIPAGFSERIVRKSVENLEAATTGQG